jgi:hypothetical protein
MYENFPKENEFEFESEFEFDEYSNNNFFLPSYDDVNKKSLNSDMNQQNNFSYDNLIESDNKEISGQNISINSGLISTANGSTLPKHYKFENIKNEIVQKLNLDEETKKAFKNDERVKSIEDETSDKNFAVKKRRRAKKGTIVKEEEKIKKQLGRKPKNQIEERKHNKFSRNNILQKIKTSIIEYLIIFINSILKLSLDEKVINTYIIKTQKKNSQNKNSEIIKPLDNQLYGTKTSRRDNLNFLYMPLKELLSQDISTKYSNFDKKANKIIIDDILENHNNKTIDFILNLKVSDWLDVFLKKKEFSDLGIKNDTPPTMNIGVEELFKKIYAENEKNYLSYFFLYIYNFERILKIIKPRKSKKKDNNDKNENISQ